MKQRHSTFAGILLHAAILVAGAIAMTPIIWLLVMSVRDPSASGTGHWSLHNYAMLWRGNSLGTWFTNSLLVASTQTVLGVTLASLAGFSLAKHEFALKRLLMAVMLVTILLPSQVILPGLYRVVLRIGWIDSYAALVVPAAVSVAGMFLFRQAMLAVPDELLAAARIDGCGELRLWWEIALPIVRPATSAYTLLSFIASWNAYLWPQIVLQSQGKFTLPLGLANLNGLAEYRTAPAVMLAGTAIGVLPVIGLFLLVARDFFDSEDQPTTGVSPAKARIG